jgi:hypothetical protein
VLAALALCVLLPLLLAACGGGGGGAVDAPAIERFSADRERFFVGERATLSVRWRGTQARIDPEPGAVGPDASVSTLPLQVDSTFTLTVDGPGGTAVSQSLTLPVAWRDRYRGLSDDARMSGHTAATLPDGSVLLIGGSRSGWAFSEKVDRYDPVSGRLAPLGTMAEGRWQPLALVLADGQVLVGAGITSGVSGRPLELIDPRNGRVTPVGLLSTSRVNGAAALLNDGRVLFCGGVTGGEGGESGLSRSCDLWDPATRAVRRLPLAMSMGRAGHAMTRLRDGRVLVSGGYVAGTPYRYAELFDPVRETFTALNSPITQVRAHQVALLHTDGSVLLIGGETWDGQAALPRAEVWRFDPQTDSFSARPPLAQARTLAAGVGLRNGQVLLFGGQTDPTRHAASAERYNPASGGVAIAALDQERAYLSASRLADGRVLVAGGETLDGGIASRLLMYE